MKILSQPEPPKKWSIQERCNECTSQLEVEETDLFRMGPEFAACPRYFVVMAAGFQCPICQYCQVISTEYPQPDVLLEYSDWRSKINPEKTYPNVVYRSPYNDYHQIHLSWDGVRILYPDSDRCLGQIMQAMHIVWHGATKYEETKALLDVHANQVFEDPEFPLNGLKRLYSAPDYQYVLFMLEERLRQSLKLAAGTKTS